MGEWYLYKNRKKRKKVGKKVEGRRLKVESKNLYIKKGA